ALDGKHRLRPARQCLEPFETASRDHDRRAGGLQDPGKALTEPARRTGHYGHPVVEPEHRLRARRYGVGWPGFGPPVGDMHRGVAALRHWPVEASQAATATAWRCG